MARLIARSSSLPLSIITAIVVAAVASGRLAVAALDSGSGDDGDRSPPDLLGDSNSPQDGAAAAVAAVAADSSGEDLINKGTGPEQPQLSLGGAMGHGHGHLHHPNKVCHCYCYVS